MIDTTGVVTGDIMIINETFTVAPILESADVTLPQGVLCRVTYPICNIGLKNANNRVYEGALWEKVFGDTSLIEKISSRALFGHAEHPEQTQSNLEKTSHVIHEMWENAGVVYQKIDILDTPTGRIVETCLRAGCMVGMSTRADGDLEESTDDEGSKYMRVIPESYHYITTDFTADPSTFGAIPQDVQHNIASVAQKQLESKDLHAGERQFATLIVESIDAMKDNKVKISEALSKHMITDGMSVLNGSVHMTAVIKENVLSFTMPDGNTMSANGDGYVVLKDDSLYLCPDGSPLPEDVVDEPLMVDDAIGIDDTNGVEIDTLSPDADDVGADELVGDDNIDNNLDGDIMNKDKDSLLPNESVVDGNDDAVIDEAVGKDMWAVEYYPAESDKLEVKKGFTSKEEATNWVKAESLEDADGLDVYPILKVNDTVDEGAEDNGAEATTDDADIMRDDDVDLLDLQVQEACMRAERDKALELLDTKETEINEAKEVKVGNKVIEMRILIAKLNTARASLAEAKEANAGQAGKLSSLTAKLDEQRALVKLRTNEVNTAVTNLSGDIVKLEETRVTSDSQHTKDISKLTESHVVAVTKAVTEAKTTVETEIAQSFINRFINIRVKESSLRLSRNSRTLLENCKTLDEVDVLLDEITDSKRRRSALRTNLTEKVIKHQPMDKEAQVVQRVMDDVFEGMG